MTKIDIFSGFLGAGKTTLIKKLLEEALAGEQVVLIENEFGEIGIDGGFLKTAGVEIREMNAGCICCSLVGDFGTALREVIDTYHPDRILIEPSGVGKLSDVIGAVERVSDGTDVILHSTVAVVDASKCKMYMRNFGEFFNDQIQYAGVIVLSRTDKVSEEKIGHAVELLRQINPDAPVVTTPVVQLDGKKILEIMEGGKTLSQTMLEEAHCPVCGSHAHGHHNHHHDHEQETGGCDHVHHHDASHHDHEEETCGCGHDHRHEHHHHADEVFVSWGCETAKTYTREEIKQILQTLSESQEYGMVLRAKGMVAGKDGQWVYFDMVPGEADIRSGAADYTGRLCVIGSGLEEEKLKQLFGCQQG